MTEDSRAQQAWWDSMTADQREAYEDAQERRRAERELDMRVREILRTLNITEPGGDWSVFDIARQLDPGAHKPRSMFDTVPPYPSDDWCEIARAAVERIDPPARYVGGVSRRLYSILPNDAQTNQEG